ncbi:MAG TPA: response regulator transcription factor [Chloroflexota bacterium]|nr:response regulator transcription factor [Chloroflexota bacterium]
MIRVVLADDQELVRQGLRMILESEPDVEVVGEAADGGGAVEMVKHENPDVLLLDVRMPGQDGIAAAKQILSHSPATRVLMLTTFDLDDYVFESLRAGASGFLLKDMSGEEIVAAVRQAAKGADSLLASAVTRRLVERFTRGRSVRASRSAVAELTKRELDVLRLIAQGLSNAEIASELRVAETTVKTHVNRLLMKLELRDRVQVVIFAYESGLVG